MLQLKSIPDRKYLEARRFLDPVARLDPTPLLRSLGLKLQRQNKNRMQVSSSSKVWLLIDGIFYRRPTREFPDFVICDDLISFAARFCGSTAKGLDTLREVYRDTPMFAESLYTDQVAALCQQFMENKLIVENIIRRGQKRAIEHKHEDPGWYRVELDTTFSRSMTAFKWASCVSALTEEELEILGCPPAKMSNIRYKDGTIPVLYFCSDPATVAEIRFPAQYHSPISDWYFRCGRTARGVPAFAPFSFCGLRALPFSSGVKELKVYSAAADLSRGIALTSNKLFALLVGAGRSLEQTFQPLRKYRTQAFVGTCSWTAVLQLASYFSDLHMFGYTNRGGSSVFEDFASIRDSVRAEWFVGQIIKVQHEQKPEGVNDVIRLLSSITFGRNRAEKIVQFAKLPPEIEARVLKELSSGGSPEETAIALDSKHTLSPDPYTSTIVDSAGASHRVYNFKAFFEKAILFGEGGSADHYTARIIFLDMDGNAQEISTMVNKRAATSWRELASNIKYACDKAGINFEPASEDITYGSMLSKHWLSMIDRAPFSRGNTFLGFSPIPGGGFVFPGITVRTTDADYTNWIPHPADAALSHFDIPAQHHGCNEALASRPGFRMLLGYCVTAAARFMLGQEIKPLEIRDSAEARVICENFFKGFGQMGPLLIRQTDGAGVYKKIFSALLGYPMWCLGPAKPIYKPMRGPVVVLDSSAELELAPDPELVSPTLPSSVFLLFSEWVAYFQQVPEDALDIFSQENPCSPTEGITLLSECFPDSGWDSFEDTFPSLSEVLLDIPKESFDELFIKHEDVFIFTPYGWSCSKKDVKKELRHKNIIAEFHGTNSLAFKAQEADKFMDIVSEFYETKGGSAIDDDE